MSFLETRQRVVGADQRRSGRFVVAIPATFRSASGDRSCKIANISENGAKLETPTPPVKGVCGMLTLGLREVYCTVIWANETGCGVEFERALSEVDLAELAGEQISRNGPVANAGRIQMGRKRSGLVS